MKFCPHLETAAVSEVPERSGFTKGQQHYATNLGTEGNVAVLAVVLKMFF